MGVAYGLLGALTETLRGSSRNNCHMPAWVFTSMSNSLKGSEICINNTSLHGKLSFGAPFTAWSEIAFIFHFSFFLRACLTLHWFRLERTNSRKKRQFVCTVNRANAMTKQKKFFKCSAQWFYGEIQTQCGNDLRGKRKLKEGTMCLVEMQLSAAKHDCVVIILLSTITGERFHFYLGGGS